MKTVIAFLLFLLEPRPPFLSLLHFLFPYFRSLKKNGTRQRILPPPFDFYYLIAPVFFLPSPPLSSRWIGRNNKNHGGERGKRGGKGRETDVVSVCDN